MRGYRVSRETIYGAAGAVLFEANREAWSGDHCSTARDLVPGVIASNVALTGSPRVIDVAPTVLHWLGVAVPEGLDGRSLVREP